MKIMLKTQKLVIKTFTKKKVSGKVAKIRCYFFALCVICAGTKKKESGKTKRFNLLLVMEQLGNIGRGQNTL